MAPTIPWGVPGRARAGDTWHWKATFPDYPVGEGWTPRFLLRGEARLEWNGAWATNSGDEWTFTIPKASTGLLPAGAYDFAVSLIGSGS